MQDRFKFRFWVTYFDDDINKNESVMQYSDNLDSENSGSYLFYNDEDVVIQQSTGLKDKNGKLIYEGDIVETWKFSTGRIERAVVKWYESQAGFKLFYTERLGATPEKFNYKRAMVGVTTIEIIGNIYENKELLEVNNG